MFPWALFTTLSGYWEGDFGFFRVENTAVNQLIGPVLLRSSHSNWQLKETYGTKLFQIYKFSEIRTGKLRSMDCIPAENRREGVGMTS